MSDTTPDQQTNAIDIAIVELEAAEREIGIPSRALPFLRALRDHSNDLITMAHALVERIKWLEAEPRAVFRQAQDTDGVDIWALIKAQYEMIESQRRRIARLEAKLSEENARNQAATPSSSGAAPTPTPRGSLPNSLGTESEGNGGW